jgi:hypothetical protein
MAWAKQYPVIMVSIKEPWKRSRYSDSQWAGRLRSESSSLGRVKNFHFSISFRPALRLNQYPIQWVPGVLSPGVKQLGHEADRSPLTSAEIKKTWMYHPLPCKPSRCSTQLNTGLLYLTFLLVRINVLGDDHIQTSAVPSLDLKRPCIYCICIPELCHTQIR